MKYSICLGPGMYNVKNPVVPGGNLVTREERFKPHISDVPGPGTYQVMSSISSLAKSIFEMENACCLQLCYRLFCYVTSRN